MIPGTFRASVVSRYPILRFPVIVPPADFVTIKMTRFQYEHGVSDLSLTVKFYDTRHFALETHAGEIGQDILTFIKQLEK